MNWTKHFLMNLLRRLPMFCVFLALAYVTHTMGSGSQDVWMQGIVEVIPIVAGIGVVLTLFLCLPGASVGDSWGEKKEESK